MVHLERFFEWRDTYAITAQPQSQAIGAGSVDMDMTELTPAQTEYLASQRLGRIATAGADGKPHVVPT